MSPEEKEHLKRLKTLDVKDDLPEDLKVAIRTFLDQAIIVGEYDLDYMPGEYMTNLLKAFAKYPEFSITLLDMIDTLDKNNLTVYELI